MCNKSMKQFTPLDLEIPCPRSFPKEITPKVQRYLQWGLFMLEKKRKRKRKTVHMPNTVQTAKVMMVTICSWKNDVIFKENTRTRMPVCKVKDEIARGKKIWAWRAHAPSRETPHCTWTIIRGELGDTGLINKQGFWKRFLWFQRNKWNISKLTKAKLGNKRRCKKKNFCLDTVGSLDHKPLDLVLLANLTNLPTVALPTCRWKLSRRCCPDVAEPSPRALPTLLCSSCSWVPLPCMTRIPASVSIPFEQNPSDSSYDSY